MNKDEMLAYVMERTGLIYMSYFTGDKREFTQEEADEILAQVLVWLKE